MAKHFLTKSLLFATLALILNACMPELDPIPESILQKVEDGTYWNIEMFTDDCDRSRESDAYNDSPFYENCRQYDSILELSKKSQAELDKAMREIDSADTPLDKSQLNSLLMLSATAGDVDSLNKLLKMGADPNAENTLKMTALMAAANNAHPECVNALLSAGAKPNVQDAQGFTALILAANAEYNPQSVRSLIKAGADVNVKANNGATALLVAAEKNCDTCIYDLVKAGADVNVAEPKYNYTPLFYTALGGNAVGMDILIKAGADINAKRSIDGATPLHMSLTRPTPYPALMLLNAGAKPNISTDDGYSISDVLEQRYDIYPFEDDPEEKQLRKAIFIARARRLFIF